MLMDGDILGVMDHSRLAQAVQMLAYCPAQKLMVVPEPLVDHFSGLPCRLFTLEIRKEMTHWACEDF
jgi:hypothetical protein